MHATLLASVAAVAVSSLSPGCGNPNYPGTPGKKPPFILTFKGVNYTHELALPSEYTPTAIHLHFHGWGGAPNECGPYCFKNGTAAGFAVIAMQGIGPLGFGSWNGSGSVASPGSRGPTCAANATNFCYDDCNGECRDNCWWTTCQDSVGQVVDVLDALSAQLCLNTSMI